MKSIPTGQFDKYMNVIEIFGPKNNLAIGPIFSHLMELQVLRIVDSNVPAIGRHSFWGLPKLRILGKVEYFDVSLCLFEVGNGLISCILSFADLQKNNITQIAEDNFRGQDNLVDLDLSKNKLDRMTSQVFSYLTVSNYHRTCITFSL